jgi:coenzyme PQQ biosynthesis protein PqqD
VDGESRPLLARRARLRFDRHAGAPLLLYPERGLALNATAGAVLALCTGEHTVRAIVDRLTACIATVTTAATIERDVLSFLSALAARGLVRDAR